MTELIDRFREDLHVGILVLVVVLAFASYGAFALFRSRLRREAHGGHFPWVILGVIVVLVVVVVDWIMPIVGGKP